MNEGKRGLGKINPTAATGVRPESRQNPGRCDGTGSNSLEINLGIVSDNCDAIGFEAKKEKSRTAVPASAVALSYCELAAVAATTQSYMHEARRFGGRKLAEF